MICNFLTEEVFERDRRGRIWAIRGPAEALWIDELRHFEQVRVVARVRDVDRPQHTVLIEDPRISLFGLPFYGGPRQFAWRFFRLVGAVRRASRQPGVFLLRLPGPLGVLMATALRLRRRPFAAQLAGDPDAVARTLDLPWIVRMLRAPLIRAVKSACRHASAITYVTETTLQRTYPPGRDATCIPFSDIDLPGHWFGQVRDAPADRPPRLLLCGSLDQLYKGADILIEALALLRRGGRNLTAAIAGDGRYRPWLEDLARQRGVSDNMAFLGNLAREDVARALDRADIFVMPSRTEGLPRALLEALAKGVPSLASRVGGIPELLEDGELFPPGDAAALADAIAALADDPQRYRALSRRGIEVAQRFRPETLAVRKAAFYTAVRALGDDR